MPYIQNFTKWLPTIPTTVTPFDMRCGEWESNFRTKLKNYSDNESKNYPGISDQNQRHAQ